MPPAGKHNRCGQSPRVGGPALPRRSGLASGEAWRAHTLPVMTQPWRSSLDASESGAVWRKLTTPLSVPSGVTGLSFSRRCRAVLVIHIVLKSLFTPLTNTLGAYSVSGAALGTGDAAVKRSCPALARSVPAWNDKRCVKQVRQAACVRAVVLQRTTRRRGKGRAATTGLRGRSDLCGHLEGHSGRRLRGPEGLRKGHWAADGASPAAGQLGEHGADSGLLSEGDGEP